MEVCGYTMQQRQSHKNLSKALNQLASLRIVIAVFNMEQEAMRAQIDRILTYGTLLDVLWQMYHAWITYGTVRRIA